MKLKCIGGFADGKIITIDYEARVGDGVRVLDDVNLKFKPMELQHPSIDIIRYVVDVFAFSSSDRHYFLRPHNWTTKEAVLFQFNK